MTATPDTRPSDLTAAEGGGPMPHAPVIDASNLQATKSDAAKLDVAAIDAALTRLEIQLGICPAATVEPAKRLADAARAIGYDFGVQRVELLLSDVRSREGDFEWAFRKQRQIAANAQNEYDRPIVARANRYLASTYFRLGMMPESMSAAAAALDLLGDDSMPSWRVEHRMAFAVFTSYYRTGVADFELFEDALREARAYGDQTLLLAVLNNYVWLAHQDSEQDERGHERRERARALADEMEELLDSSNNGGSDSGEISAAWLDTLAVIRLEQGRLDVAEPLLERALAQAEVAEPDAYAALMTHLAQLRRRQGQPSEARKLLERARAQAMAINTPEFAIEALQQLAEIDAEQQDFHSAYRRLRRLMEEQRQLDRHEAERRAAALQSVHAAQSERERRRYYEDMARHDELTGLYNRRYLFERLPQLLAAGPVTIAFVDIDSFKAINDEHSHSTGDAVLRAVSALLTKTVNKLTAGAFAARLGGDELVAVVPLHDSSPPANAFENLRHRVALGGFDNTPADLHVTVSIGLATGSSTDTCDSLLARADESLYCAKRAGRDRIMLADEPERTATLLAGSGLRASAS